MKANKINATPIAMANAIVMKAIGELAPYKKNARTHSDEQIDQIAASILEFGFTNPILVDSKHGVIAGHGRLTAAKQLGLTEVPVVVLDHLSSAQKQAYIIADNKLAELAGWDENLLAQELAELRDVDYNLDLIGFDEHELKALLSSLDQNMDSNENNEEDDLIPEVADDPVSQAGQLWVLGKHLLLCADACEASSFKQLLGKKIANMTFTDPPYNVNYRALPTAKKSAPKRGRSRGQLISNDNLHGDFTGFLGLCCKHILTFTQGACYICMGASELHTLRSAFTQAGGCCANFIVWAKNHFTMGSSDYQHQYEMILYGWPTQHEHFWCGKRDQSDIWQIAREAKNTLHPTMKPVPLCERAIVNSSQTDDIVLDCFAGSGSTLIACENTHRRARVMELEPGYVDVIIKRWQAHTGMQAIDEKTGKRFDALLNEQAQEVKA